MALEAPEWLTQHGGSLKAGSDEHTCYVMLNGQPLYAVVPRPVAGKFGCTVIQTNNGQRIETNTLATSELEAQRLGLDELRQALGW
jgi:hypothetical protein